MLHDIEPNKFDNDFAFEQARADDKVVVFRGKDVLVHAEGNKLTPTTFADFGIEPASVDTAEGRTAGEEGARYLYLFSVGSERYFFAEVPESAIERVAEQEGAQFIAIKDLIDYEPKTVRFALTVAYEYWTWYESAQFCGRCGSRMRHDRRERMMRCPECGLMVFPKLFPAVIIGITRPDGKVLVTRYAGRPYANYALVAGFCEMGETVEQTVHREVMEEVGLRVKNLRYYKSQPWPDSSSLLFGFFCELDGSSEINLDEHELSMAEWIDRDGLLTDNDNSLTREIMGVLRENRERDYCIVEA